MCARLPWPEPSSAKPVVQEVVDREQCPGGCLSQNRARDPVHPPVSLPQNSTQSPSDRIAYSSSSKGPPSASTSVRAFSPPTTRRTTPSPISSVSGSVTSPTSPPAARLRWYCSSDAASRSYSVAASAVTTTQFGFPSLISIIFSRLLRTRFRAFSCFSRLSLCPRCSLPAPRSGTQVPRSGVVHASAFGLPLASWSISTGL